MRTLMPKLSFVALSIFVIFLSACNNKTNNITIGANLPLTGDIASYGKRAQKGIDLAIEEINAKTQNGFYIKIDYQDNQGLPKEAVNIMQKFASINKYNVVIGGASSSESIAMAPIANENHIILISPISSSPELTVNGGDYFFRVCPSDAFQAKILARWIKSLSIQNIAILFANNTWGSSLKNEFVTEFTNIGGKIIMIESCVDGDRNFRTQLTKIINSKPDAIYCPTYGKEGGLILKQLKELGFTKPIFGSDVWSSSELLESAGNAANGVFLVKPADPTGNLFDEFKNKYIRKYNEEPDVYAAYSYDLIMIIYDAIYKGNRTGSEIRNYLLNMPPYNGITGKTAFDKNGDCNTKDFIRQTIKNNTYIKID